MAESQDKENISGNTDDNKCRSLVPLHCQTIALYPPSAQRNLHPSASTCHLHPSVSGFLSQNHLSGYAFSTTASQRLQFPAMFQQLEDNTDIRVTPSAAHLRQVPVHRPLFCSFQMAHKFVDIVRRVDVVSDAENIKELLKMPFNPKAEVSLLVHRVGRTLLIDQFSKIFLEQERSDLEWLRAFQDVVFKALRKRDSRDYQRATDMQPNAWQLLNHFLQITIAQQQQQQRAQQTRSKRKLKGRKKRNLPENKDFEALEIESSDAVVAYNSTSLTNSSEIVHNEDTTAVIAVNFVPSPSTEEQNEAMPEPKASDHFPLDELRGSHDSQFARNIIWNFEDLRMLIGTDLPIFGGDTRPCVSLRLADMSKPINVLTGLDYWLDNLMCNVPEVAMCYHLSGIVQKYERIKTEELPELHHSKFSPELVRDIAKNILAFLKDNTTHEGHTYWLFKKENDDVVKLYDLTSLGLGTDNGSAKFEDISGHIDGLSSITNPFTIPAGMLFYRMAKNILEDEETRAKKMSTISQLLHNAIKLIDAMRFPEIVSSAHYHIAEVLLTGVEGNKLEDIESECSSDEDDLSERASAARNGSGVLQSQDNRAGISNKIQKETASRNTNRKKKHRELSSMPNAVVSSCTPESKHAHVGPSSVREDDTEQPSIVLSQLCHPNSSKHLPLPKYRPSRLPKDYLSRCEVSLAHIIEGLWCLQGRARSGMHDHMDTSGDPAFNNTQENDVNSSVDNNEEKEPQMAKSYEAIPLPFESLNIHRPLLRDTSQVLEQPFASHDVARLNKFETDVYENNTNDHLNATVASVDRAMVPSTNCCSVLLSNLKYDVPDMVTKLRVLMLHKMATVYKLLAESASTEQKLIDAVKFTKMCIRCCYAICYDLGITSVADASFKTIAAYPLMEQALFLAASNFCSLAMNWNKVMSTSKVKDSIKDKMKTCENTKTSCLQCRWLLETSRQKLCDYLNSYLPAHYLAQMQLPLKVESVQSCFVLGQYYLFLALGGKPKYTTEYKDGIQPITIEENLMAAYNNFGELTSQRLVECGFNPDKFLALAGPYSTDPVSALQYEAAKSFNVDMSSLTEDRLLSQKDVTLLLAALINEITRGVIDETQKHIPTDPSVSEKQCSQHIVDLLVIYRRLLLAYRLFSFTNNLTNCAFVIGNMGKCFRVAAKFLPNAVKQCPFDVYEDQYHKFAVSKLQNVLTIAEMKSASSSHRNKIHNRKKPKSKVAESSKGCKIESKMQNEGLSNFNSSEGANADCFDQKQNTISFDTLISHFSINCAIAMRQHAEEMILRTPQKRDEQMSCAADLLLRSFELLQQVTPQASDRERVLEHSAHCASSLSFLYTCPNSSCTVSADPVKALYWRKKHMILTRDPFRSVLDHSQNIMAMSSDNSATHEVKRLFILKGLHFMVKSSDVLPRLKHPIAGKRNKQTDEQINISVIEKYIQFVDSFARLLQKLCHLCKTTPNVEPNFILVKEMYSLILRTKGQGFTPADSLLATLSQIKEKLKLNNYE